MRPFALALALLALAACETYERPLHEPNAPLVRTDLPTNSVRREERLVQATEERPEDPAAWCALGQYYEDLGQFEPAHRAYLRMQQEIDRISYQQGTQYTGGHFCLARTYYRLGDVQRSVEELRAVLAMQPDDVQQAVLNQDFRESHFVLGQIYFEHRQWELAKSHLTTFRELGGQPERCEGMIFRCDEALDGRS